MPVTIDDVSTQITSARRGQTALNFWVDLGNDYDHITFTECSGLIMQTDVAKISEGGQNHYDRKYPGKTTFGNVVLRHGVDTHGSLFEWYWNCITRGFTRKNITIHIYPTESGDGPIVSWHLLNAFPARWEGPALSTPFGGIAVETLEFAFEVIESQTMRDENTASRSPAGAGGGGGGADTASPGSDAAAGGTSPAGAAAPGNADADHAWGNAQDQAVQNASR